MVKRSVAVAAAFALLSTPMMLAGASHAALEHDVVVSADPVDWTPHVENTDFGPGVRAAKVRATATVGDITVAGGDFTTVREQGASSTIARSDIFAFDGRGKVLSAFAPDIDGSQVYDVIPAGDGRSVFVAGAFRRVDGLRRTAKVVKLDVTTGEVVRSFRSPGFNRRAHALHLADGRLYVAGIFERVGGRPRTALVALDPETGQDTGFVDLGFANTFNGGRVGIEKMTVTPDGSTMVVIGNFRTIEGQRRVQIAMIDLTGAGASLTSWATDRFSTSCHPHFETYMWDVDSSPDGTYFAVATTGAFSGGVNSGTLCDSASRWEFGTAGGGQQPTWVDYFGGDTLTAVEVTGSAVYVGGHFRWANNPFVADRVGPGAIRRMGIAALDPRNGMPFRWNPSRKRGWGVWGFRATEDGLWVGHDTDKIGRETHKRIALMPLAGGRAVSPDNTGSLPGQVVLLGKRDAASGPSPVLYRVNAAGPALLATDGGPDWASDEAGAPSSLHNSGSREALWSQSYEVSDVLPDTTPTQVFNSERWDPSGAPEMSWDFPVDAGLPLEVRLYFANGYSGTSQPGQRRFDVVIDGDTVLDDYDIVSDVGDRVGTMKAFRITSDGNVDVDFGHVVENPLVNAVEIVRTDIQSTPSSNDGVVGHDFSGRAVTGTRDIDPRGVDWSSARGAFMVDGVLFTGWADGTFTRRCFRNGTRFCNAANVRLFGLTAFEEDLASIRAMFFDRETGRMYFTKAGSDNLFYRYFTPQSRYVGAVRFVAPAGSGVDWSEVSGAFLVKGKLYVRTRGGNLRVADWSSDGTAGATSLVSGPEVDGVDWRSRALFLEAR